MTSVRMTTERERVQHQRLKLAITAFILERGAEYTSQVRKRFSRATDDQFACALAELAAEKAVVLGSGRSGGEKVYHPSLAAALVKLLPRKPLTPEGA